MGFLRIVFPDSPVECDMDRKYLEGQIVSVSLLDSPDIDAKRMRIVSAEFPGDGSLVLELKSLQNG